MSSQHAQLAEAFQAFNTLSAELSAAYHGLQERVACLSEELEATRLERTQELTEKTRLANRLTRLLEALPGGVVVLDADGRILESNPAAHACLGIELIDQHWQTVRAHCFEAGQTEPGEVRLIDGRILSISSSTLAPEPGQILLMQDLTAIKQLEAQVQRNRRLAAMGEMTARIAHQVRTPLSTALLYVHHLAVPELGADKRARFARKATDGLQQLDRMVNDMLAFSRGGGWGLERVGVSDLLAQVQLAVMAILAQQSARLAISNAAAHQAVTVNREGLVGALSNLVVNALEAVGEGAVIELRAECTSPDLLRLEVIDQGPGILPSEYERLFEPFYTTKTGGTGLGLSVVRTVIESHGGQVEIHSQPGQGTCFALYLPVDGVAGQLASDASAANPGTHTRQAPAGAAKVLS